MTGNQFKPGDEVVIRTTLDLWNGYRAFVKTGEVTTEPEIFGNKVSLLIPLVELVPGIDGRPDGGSGDFYWTADEVHLTGE